MNRRVTHFALADHYLKYGFRIENMDGNRYVWDNPEGYVTITPATDTAYLPENEEDPIMFRSHDKDGKVLLEQRYESSTDLVWHLLAMKLMRVEWPPRYAGSWG